MRERPSWYRWSGGCSFSTAWISSLCWSAHFLATALTLPVNSVVGWLRLPLISGTFVAAVILAAVPNLLAAAGLSFSIAAAVVGGLFIYLPGRAFVTAVIDGLANAPVSAITRAFEALITAGALALGVMVGGEIGAGLGVELQADVTSAPLWVSVLAAGVGVLGIAVAWECRAPG